MKFGRYLEESQTPEWKKKYINYRILKKLNKAIQRELDEKTDRGTLSSRQDGQASGSAANSVQVNVSPIQTRARNPRQRSTSIMTAHSSSVGARSPGPSKSLESYGFANSPENRRQYGAMGRTPPLEGRASSVRIGARSKTDIPDSEGFALPPPARSFSEHNVSVGDHIGSRPQMMTHKRGASFLSQIPFGRSKGKLSSDVPVTFNAYTEALTSFSPAELRFFEFLEKEVLKVEAFFIERQREGAVKLAAIKLQFKELVDHRRIFQEYEATRGNKWNVIPTFTSQTIEGAWQYVRRGNLLKVEEDADVGMTTPYQAPRLDPEEYHSAKKKLKHAVQEHYRYLELLNDYRILNLEAIRKAVKKFEKTTNLRVKDAFYRTKVEGLDITDDQLLKSMIKEIEDTYADRFEGGSMKKARSRLRMDPSNKAHHFSTFKSGMNIGLAIPALVSGVYQVLHPNIRHEVPEWRPLLVVYGALAIPSVFALIIGLNLLAWARARINYVFIFDLDLRTVLDHREYFEIPSFLFMALCYAFALSFNKVFNVTPTIWPLVWLFIVLLTVALPLKTAHRSSRSWLVRSFGRLLTPGFGPVGFTDFWMGDQFCSLVFTLSHIFYIGCAYSYDIGDWAENDVNAKCSLTEHWLAGFFLSSLPSLIRLIQCVKRWLDSGLYIHLINGGKYSASVLTYALYFHWRHHANSAHTGSAFAGWVFFAVVNSIYTISWDILMDWSLFQSQAQRPLLRRELIYSRTWVYYFALFTNTLGRFAWVIYIPGGSFDNQLRGFIGACLEMLRRLQWNFFRLENEHIGNTDQYRVTKEVPLPYKFTNEQAEQDDSDSDKEDVENHARSPRKFSLHRRRPSQPMVAAMRPSDPPELPSAPVLPSPQVLPASNPWRDPEMGFTLDGSAPRMESLDNPGQVTAVTGQGILRKGTGLIGPPMSPVWGTGLGVVQKPPSLDCVNE